MISCEKKALEFLVTMAFTFFVSSLKVVPTSVNSYINEELFLLGII